LNGKYLFEIITAIDDLIVLSAEDGVENKVNSSAKLFRTVLIAAILSLLLAACGYAIFLASMTYREPQISDEKNYYINQRNTNGHYVEVNNGDCALALHFDTDEAGKANGFSVDEKNLPGFSCTSTSSLWELFNIFYDEDFIRYPVCMAVEALHKAGMTKAEAEALYNRASFVRSDARDEGEIHVILYDSPYLAQNDLILGWPEGTAIVEREDIWGEYQRLELVVDKEWGSGRQETFKHLFLFHPEGQYLLQLSAEDENFTFEELGLVAESLRPVQTDLEYDLRNGRVNYSIADHGSG